MLVERAAKHAFAPSFHWLMTGERRAEQITRDLRALVSPRVEVLRAEARAIDLPAGRLETDGGAVVYDYLVLALGAELAHHRMTEGFDRIFHVKDGQVSSVLGGDPQVEAAGPAAGLES